MAAPAHIARQNGRKGGRPRGSKSKETLEKEAVQKVLNQRILAAADRLLDYQMSLARGTTYLFKVEKELVIGPKGGKTYKAKRPELVTDVDEIRSYLEGLIDNGDLDDPKDRSATYYYITTKDHDSHAINSMFDRALGKPTQAMDLDVKSDGEKLKVFDESQITRIASRIINARNASKK